MAAITVIIYSQFLLTTLYIGFSMGVAPVISYNYGSENVKQLRKVVRICFCFTMIISIFVFLFSFFAGENIAKVFTDIWIYYSFPFGFAEIFAGNRSMVSDSYCGITYAYADDIFDIQKP